MTSNPIALRLHEIGLQMEGTGHDELVAALGIAEREIERLHQAPQLLRSDVNPLRDAMAWLRAVPHTNGNYNNAVATLEHLQGMLERALSLRSSGAAPDAAAVKPPVLWALHVQGPDDVYAAPNWAAAAEATAWLEHQFTQRRILKDPDLPAVAFAVVPWPHSAEAHAKELPRWPEVYPGTQTAPSTKANDRCPR